ncbi:MAG: hypothetical protein KatS3mg131_2298 [Candidatus Tectimicrobiota bacterium]|nr:MAG: hypothetical protein KatS3mg131_2298 [Candidatus Tectomicrobia bacterium]
MQAATDRVVLAVECGRCQQLTRVSGYGGALYLARCSGCGRPFPAAEALLRQYQEAAERLAGYAALEQALAQARAAMATALAQWGRKAGREALVQALGGDAAATLPG